MEPVSLASRGIALVCVFLLGCGVRPAAALAQQTDAATRQYAAAAALQNRGVYNLAAQEWQAFVEKYGQDPRAGQAYHYLGVCHYQQGQFEPALAAFQKVLAEHPKSDVVPGSMLLLGVSQYSLAQAGKAGMHDAAVRTLRTLLAQHPKSEHVPDALYYLGETLYALGQKAEAIRTYAQFLNRFPGHKLTPEATYAMGVALEETQQVDTAGKTYDDFLRRFPQHRLAREVQMRRGETLLASGDAAEAAKRFAAAAAENSPLADYATLRHGDALAQQKRYDQAAEVYASIPRKFPQSQHAGRAVLWAGKSYHLAGKAPEAERLLSGLVDSGGPLAGEAAHWLAQTLLAAKQPEKALAVVERAQAQAGGGAAAAALAIDRADASYEIPDRRASAPALYAAAAAKYAQDPAAPTALYLAGFSALGLRDAKTAMQHASSFLSKYPRHALEADALRVAAESSLQLGDFADADRRYQQLLSGHADHADAETWRVRRVVALHAQQKYPETVAAVQALLPKLRAADNIAEARFLLGNSQLELKQPAAAIAALSASLEAQPQWRQADQTLLALAEAHRQAGDLGKAKVAIERLLAQFPASPLADRARYRLGEYHWQSGDFSAAAEQYRQVAQRPDSPLAPQALHELGCAQLNQKDAAAAEQSLTEFLTRHAQHALAPHAHYARGMARHQLKKYAEAAEDLEAMLAADPTSKDRSDARLLLGLSQIELKRYEPAAATLRALLAESPNYANADKARYQLAWALRLAGRGDEAGKAFAELAAKHGQSALAAEAQHHVAEIAYQAKDYSAAAKAYYEVVQSTDGTELGEKASHKLGWSYYHLENYPYAQKTFAYQLKRYPNGPLAADGRLMMAECLFKQEKYAEALAAYTALKEFSGPEFEMLALLHGGQAAAQLKQWNQGAQWLARGVEKFPDSPSAPEALYEFGWALQNLGKLDEAVARYEQVVAKTDREAAARAQFMIGEIQFGKGQHNEAVRSFFKVAYGYNHPKWQADATYEAGRCFEVLGQKTQAVKMYQELLEKFPQSDRASLARQRVAELKG